MGKPTLSVFIPVYNAEQYLPDCLDSILNQTLSDMEIYIFDDGSTDNSYEVCRKYAERDPRIRLSRGVNGQSDDKMNEFLRVAAGDVIAFVDNDDYLDPDYFEKMVTALKNSGADCAVSSYTLIDSRKNKLDWYTPNLKDGQILSREEILRKFLTTLEIEGFRWNKFYKKEVFRDNDFSFPDAYPVDINGEVRLLSLCDRVILVDSHGYYYRQSATSEVATPNKFKTLNFMKTYRDVAAYAKSCGMEHEGEYYRIWRSVNMMFNTWKMRASHSDWEEVKSLLAWKEWIGQPLPKVVVFLSQYSNERETPLKFMIKTLLVRWIYL